MKIFFTFFDQHLAYFLIFNLLLYLTSGVLFCLRRERMARVGFGFAFVINVGIISINWLGCGHPPLGNMYHVLTVLSACFFPIWLVVTYYKGIRWLLPYLALAAVIPLVGTLFMKPSISWQRIPALQSYWFVPHVLAYMISYALAAVAFIVALVSLGKKEDLTTSCYRNEYERAVHSLIRLSMPFMTFGLLSGALWADSAWGSYWSWDPKESWALITWLLYLGYLHCVKSVAWRGKKAIYISIFAFFALIVTFLVVNLLPKFANSLHSYT